MPDLTPLAKILIAGGIVMILTGAAILLGPHFPLGRLPGDFYYQKGDFTFYFPLVSGIIISIVLTILVNFFTR